MADDLLTFLNKIQTQYPAAVGILSQPGVAAVYKQAVDEGWSGDRLEAALEQTQWWQTTNAAQRAFQALQVTDPRTATQKVEQARRTIDDLQKSLGIALDANGGFNSPAFAFLRDAVTNGWDANEIRYRLIQSVNSTQGMMGGGELATAAAKVKSMADDYGVPFSDQETMAWGRKMLQGAVTPEGMQGYFIEAAKSLFPALSSALDAGVTVKQYAAPYLSLAQQELDINPADINLTDQKWMAALNQVDPKTGQRTSMSLDSWLAKLRTDPSYGYDTTSKGRQDATTLATQLSAKFGASA